MVTKGTSVGLYAFQHLTSKTDNNIKNNILYNLSLILVDHLMLARMYDYFIREIKNITHQQCYQLWLVLYEHLVLFSSWDKVHCNKIKRTVYIVLCSFGHHHLSSQVIKSIS